MDIVSTASAPAPRTAANPELMKAAQELETAFLAEMLNAAGLATARESFGGGAGEDQFASFLAREQARVMVQAGGIGLSESIYHALREQENED